MTNKQNNMERVPSKNKRLLALYLFLFLCGIGALSTPLLMNEKNKQEKSGGCAIVGVLLLYFGSLGTSVTINDMFDEKLDAKNRMLKMKSKQR